jgi:predicted nucleic acid-binding protein
MNCASGSATEALVINTGPLIAFARGGVLDEVGRLPLRFLCPTEVQEEIKQGVTAGHPPINPSWLSIEALTQPLSLALLASLGAGEAAVIQLAKEQNIPMVCIDEVKGRQVARAMSLAVTGSLGVLVRAKRLGIIGRAAR